MKPTALRLVFGLLLLAVPLPAQPGDAYKSLPAGHEKNRQLADNTYADNLKKYRGDTNILVLPGLVADRQKQRVEVLVESTQLAPNAPCEFTIIGAASEHAYESLLVSFARPSAIHQAMVFIGLQPGEPVDPAACRLWSRGECVVLSLLPQNEPPLRLEKMFLDQRTGKTLSEQGFRFTGSRWVPDPKNPRKKVYAADAYQPMAIVSLFNSPDSVLEVPYAAAQSEVYQSTVVNPEHPLKEGSLLTLLIQPVAPAQARPARDLVLQVHSIPAAPPATADGLERLKSMTFQLTDSATVLNDQPTISSVVQALAGLNREKIDYYLTVRFGDDVELGGAQALAKILLIMDSERGIRINPPPAGQLYYRAFVPDRDLLDRHQRMDQPWELSLTDKAGAVTGQLLRVDSVWTNGAANATLVFHTSPVAGPQDLRQAFAAEAGTAQDKNPGRLPVILVFAPATLNYGQLTRFLAPALATRKVVQVYVGETWPPIPAPSANLPAGK